MSALRFERRPQLLVSLTPFLLGTLVIVGSLYVGTQGSSSTHELVKNVAPLLIIPLGLWLFLSERYEWTLAFALVYLGLFDGSLKLITGSSVATLGRDVILYAITLGAVARMIIRRTKIVLPPFTGFVLAWVAVCLMQLLNPSDISITHSIAALRQHLEFVPLFFFGFAVLRSERRIMGLLILLIAIGALNGIFDVIQSSLSRSALASWGPGYHGLLYGTSENVARIGITASGQIIIRPPGLGGTDGFGGFVCMMALPAVLVTFSSARRAAKLAVILIPAVVVILLGIITSETRLDVVAAFVVVVAFAGLTATSRRGLAALVLTVLLLVAGYVAFTSFTASHANRYSSITPAHVLGTAFNTRRGTLSLIPTYASQYPFGAGIGSVGPAAESSIGGQTSNHGLNAESEFTFLLVETGLPGLLVMFAFALTMVATGFRLRRVEPSSLQRCLMALTALLIMLLLCWTFTPVSANSPTSPMIWLASGTIAYWYGELRAGRVPTRAHRMVNTFAAR